ncbi:hypothetical protein Dip510_001926 [Elusimicrobium posterum]|uniref:hypothetical protein n=1 Tax=Elusimicrobium posterum TaxID=3116653 RepID=UPI003C73B720
MINILKKVVGFLVPGKLSGVVKTVQGFLSGKKTYLAATILLLEGLMSLGEQVVGLSGTGDLVNMIQNFGGSEGFVRIAEALAVFGIRAALPFKK